MRSSYYNSTPTAPLTSLMSPQGSGTGKLNLDTVDHRLYLKYSTKYGNKINSST